ncbi:MAG: hypothetical protein ACYC8T_04950, partial [Myxococcaceae bacterium]
QSRLVFAAAVLGFMALLYFAVRNAGLEPWVAAALSTVMIGVGVELTCYYYCFVLALALLLEKRREVGLLLLAFTAITQFIGWAPLSAMSRWEDEKYAAMSFAAIITFALVLWLFTKDGTRYCLAPELVPAPGGDGPKGREKKKRRGG